MTSSLLAAQSPPQEVPEPGKHAVRILKFAPASSVVPSAVRLERPAVVTRPTRVLLGTLSDLGFRAVKPIPVKLETQDGSVVACWPEVDEFGIGESMSSACAELGHTLAELYRSLETEESKLGPDLRRVWTILKEYISRRR